MASYCATQNYWGSSTWLRIQSQEEYSHAMKLLDFMLDRNAPVTLDLFVFFGGDGSHRRRSRMVDRGSYRKG